MKRSPRSGWQTMTSRRTAQSVVLAGVAPRLGVVHRRTARVDLLLLERVAPRGMAVLAAGLRSSTAITCSEATCTISFLGKPSTTSPWMLQFGGHHLALNITIVGSKGIMTPSLTGAQPAVFKVDGKTIRPLGRESDEALTLLQSLDAKQRSQAVLNYKVADLVLGPGQDGKQISPEGLRVSAMNDRQKALLLQVIAEWAGIMNDTMASARMAQLKSELNDTWFAWSGATDLQVGTNINAYYRIQGPHLVIEYAPQSDEPTNHVHTIYRDPTNDYGQGAIEK